MFFAKKSFGDVERILENLARNFSQYRKNGFAQNERMLISYHTLDGNSRPHTPDPYQYPLRLDKQTSNHPPPVLYYHILLVNRVGKNLQSSTITRNRELNKLAQTTIEIKIELRVNFVELNIHPDPNSTQIKHRTITSPFVVTSLQYTSTDEPPVDHQWGNLSSYNSISGLKYKTTL